MPKETRLIYIPLKPDRVGHLLKTPAAKWRIGSPKPRFRESRADLNPHPCQLRLRSTVEMTSAARAVHFPDRSLFYYGKARLNPTVRMQIIHIFAKPWVCSILISETIDNSETNLRKVAWTRVPQTPSSSLGEGWGEESGVVLFFICPLILHGKWTWFDEFHVNRFSWWFQWAYTEHPIVLWDIYGPIPFCKPSFADIYSTFNWCLGPVPPLSKAVQASFRACQYSKESILTNTLSSSF